MKRAKCRKAPAHFPTFAPPASTTPHLIWLKAAKICHETAAAHSWLKHLQIFAQAYATIPTRSNLITAESAPPWPWP